MLQQHGNYVNEVYNYTQSIFERVDSIQLVTKLPALRNLLVEDRGNMVQKNVSNPPQHSATTWI